MHIRQSLLPLVATPRLASQARCLSYGGLIVQYLALCNRPHANFIVNVGDCTALDIELLIRHMKDTVLEKQGVALQQEVRVIGEYA